MSKIGVLSDKKVCDIPRRKKKFGLASFDNSEEVVSDIARREKKLCQVSSDNSEEVSDVLKTELDWKFTLQRPCTCPQFISLWVESVYSGKTIVTYS